MDPVPGEESESSRKTTRWLKRLRSPEQQPANDEEQQPSPQGALRRRPKIGILGSTRGTNTLHVYAEIAAGRLDAEVVAVVSNLADAVILERARAAGVATVLHIPSKGKKRAVFDADVNAALEAAGVELVLLVGFMRILSPVFVRRWRGRCLNVHPSLLPKHAGLMDLQAHEAVLAAGDTETGCTVHLVEEVNTPKHMMMLAVQIGPIWTKSRAALSYDSVQIAHELSPTCQHVCPLPGYEGPTPPKSTARCLVKNKVLTA